MKVRNIALAAATAGALALGSAAFAQEDKKPDPAAKPEASQPHRSEHGRHGMGRMHETRGGACEGGAQGEAARGHQHS